MRQRAALCSGRRTHKWVSSSSALCASRFPSAIYSRCESSATIPAAPAPFSPTSSSVSPISSPATVPPPGMANAAKNNIKKQHSWHRKPKSQPRAASASPRDATSSSSGSRSSFTAPPSQNGQKWRQRKQRRQQSQIQDGAPRQGSIEKARHFASPSTQTDSTSTSAPSQSVISPSSSAPTATDATHTTSAAARRSSATSKRKPAISLSDLVLQRSPPTEEDTPRSSSGAVPGRPRSWFHRESTTVGYVYRKHPEEPHRAEPPTVKPLPKLSPRWRPLQLTVPQQVVQPPVEIPVPRLAHGLKRVVFNEGVHPLKDFMSQEYMFNPFLAKVHQPTDVNFEAMPPFVTTSKDKILHRLAGENGARFKGSTSSMSPTLAQLYRLLSGFKGPDLSCLSWSYHHLPSHYTKTSCKPVCLFLRPKDGIYSIDSDPGNIPIAANQILLDLGKSMERMLTTEPEEYEREFLRSGNSTGKFNGPEAYHYLKMGDFLLRSQLDCHEPDLPGDRKTFDLKTRATMMVRMHMEKYEQQLDYRISSVRGTTGSYEREFYDICRAAMLKYWYQVRIGQMNGIFIFGFEYLKQEEMERIMFGNSEFAEIAFQGTMNIWQHMLSEITSRAPPDKTLRVVLWADKHSREMDVFVEPVEFDSGWLEPAMSTSSGDMGMINAKTSGQGYINQLAQRSSAGDPLTKEEDLERYEWLKTGKFLPTLNWYKLRLATFVNGRPLLDRELNHRTGDRLDVFYDFEEVAPSTEQGMLKMLKTYKSLLHKSMLYAEPEEEEVDVDDVPIGVEA